MRCINRRLTALCLAAITAVSLAGCGNLKYEMAYEPDSAVSGFNVMSARGAETAQAFSANLCVVTGDITDDEAVDMSKATAAVLFDVNNKEVVYSKNAHERLHPASLTKVMTALVALKNGSLDQVLTATDNVNITESGAVLCGLKSGDSMTLDQALHVLLIHSANDAAMLIAENIAGSPERYVEMMNEEALRLGATNTNFVNPHGLTDDAHYTTAYDLYLIFNEAIKYEAFNQIIHTTSYQTTYYDKNGEAKELSFSNSNWYLSDKAKAPENVTVLGGKTGSTKAARSCLILLSKDTSGAPYISVILSAESRDVLYQEMTDLLDEINK